MCSSRPARCVARSRENRGLYRGALANGEPGRGLVGSAFGRDRRSQRPGRLGASRSPARVELPRSGRRRRTGAAPCSRSRTASISICASLAMQIEDGRAARSSARFAIPISTRTAALSYFLVTREGDAVRFHRSAPDGTGDPPGSDAGAFAGSPEDLLERPRQGARADASRARRRLPQPSRVRRASRTYVYRKPPRTAMAGALRTLAKSAWTKRRSRASCSGSSTSTPTSAARR